MNRKPLLNKLSSVGAGGDLFDSIQKRQQWQYCSTQSQSLGNLGFTRKLGVYSEIWGLLETWGLLEIWSLLETWGLLETWNLLET